VKRGKLDQIRWDSVAKIGAGVLLAVAIATSLPSLLGSDQPKPLEPDVGLPQAALPPPAPVVPAPAPKPVKQKRHKAQKKPPRRRRPRHKPKSSEVSGPAPVFGATAPALPSGSVEDFGFERP
jgi:outer membrane biosynthesis protein TonB